MSSKIHLDGPKEKTMCGVDVYTVNAQAWDFGLGAITCQRCLVGFVRKYNSIAAHSLVAVHDGMARIDQLQAEEERRDEQIAEYARSQGLAVILDEKEGAK